MMGDKPGMWRLTADFRAGDKTQRSTADLLALFRARAKEETTKAKIK